MEAEKLTSAIEAVLFASEHPVDLNKFMEVFEGQGVEALDIKTAIDSLKERYADSRYGFEVREAQGGYHFVTKAAHSEVVRKFLQSRPFRLGKSTLEVLAIIAYRQPITRAQIDSVRGIESSHILRTLIERGVVKMAGKAELPGRPVQYATTPKFLEICGFASVNDLPPLSELEQLTGHTEEVRPSLEEGLDRFIEQTNIDQELDTFERVEGKQGLAEIEQMIAQADTAPKEIYESAEAAEVAKANLEAMAALQESMKPRRKPRTEMTYEAVLGQAPGDRTDVLHQSTETIIGHLDNANQS